MKKLLSPLAAFACYVIFVALPTSLRAQQIFNGSFELSPASSTVSSAGLGWTQSVPGQCFVLAYSTPDATNGSQFLYIGTGGISQTIPGQFTVGIPYEISFSARDTMNGTVPNIGISVSGGASAGQNFYMPRGGPYNVYKFDFTATSNTPITVAFGGSYPLSIDNIVLVPEPSTWTLLCVGTVVLGASVRRRKKALVLALR